MAWGCMQPAFLEYLLCHLKMHFWLQNARLHRKVITYKRLNSFEQRRAMGTNITRMLIRKICIITILKPWHYKASNSQQLKEFLSYLVHQCFIIPIHIWSILSIRNVEGTILTIDRPKWQLSLNLSVTDIFICTPAFCNVWPIHFPAQAFSPFWGVVKS